MLGLGPMELMIVGIIAVLLFGNRLPEVGRSLGKGLIEFKKGLRDIQNEVDISSTSPPATRTNRPSSLDEVDQATAPKFIPPTGEPTATAAEDDSRPLRHIDLAPETKEPTATAAEDHPAGTV